MTKNIRLVLGASCMALSGACVGRSVPRAVTTLPPATPTVAGPNTGGPWRLGAAAAMQRVAVTTRAVVTISGDPATRVDTLAATLEARYTAPGGGRRIDGSLLDYRVAVGSAVAAAPAGLTVPRAFALDAQGVFRVPAEATACTEPMLSVLQGMHEAWIPLPDTLVMGREWSDTVHTMSCRDRLPVRGVVVRRFRVQRAEVEGTRVLLTIERRSKGKLNADGDQFGEPVSLEGTSEGTLHYVLDVAAGHLVRATGNAVLELSFKSKRRNQRVRQESELSLVWTR